MIKTIISSRPSGQSHVLKLAAPPLPIVKIAFVGLGVRGQRAITRMLHMAGVEIVALCDIRQENTQAANRILDEFQRPPALEFYGKEEAWLDAVSLPQVDLVYIATDWVSHARIAVEAMKSGKHVAVEVPAAMNMQEIWELVDTAEKTRKHCIQLENCVYDFFELTVLNMAQQGLLGEIMHADGGYIHFLQQFWTSAENNWRLDYNEKFRGDIYPTHGIGPLCQAMNIHRGDKLNFLVSIDTKAVGNPAFIKSQTGREVADFRNGDHTTTIIRTQKEKTIQIQHNIASPRPYSRMYQLTGTAGFASKYPTEAFAFMPSEYMAAYADFQPYEFIPEAMRQELMEKYKHPILNGIEEQAKQIDYRGGLNFIMDYRLIYCLQKGLPLDMDVYDLAEWCCLIPLSEMSLDAGSMPVEIPDFTRGHWNEVKGLEFALHASDE
ncbi:MAG: Gfo/Idh/MocA family protein [Mangrovibacterium sp.]